MASGGSLDAAEGEPLVGRQGPVNARSMRATRSAKACRSRRTSASSTRQGFGNGVYALLQAPALRYQHGHANTSYGYWSGVFARLRPAGRFRAGRRTRFTGR